MSLATSINDDHISLRRQDVCYDGRRSARHASLADEYSKGTRSGGQGEGEAVQVSVLQ